MLKPKKKQRQPAAAQVMARFLPFTAACLVDSMSRIFDCQTATVPQQCGEAING
jgi:hypothetical protein